MCIAEEGATGSFVHTAGFDTDEPILDNVDTTNGVSTGNFVGVHEEFEGVGLRWFMLSMVGDIMNDDRKYLRGVRD